MATTSSGLTPLLGSLIDQAAHQVIDLGHTGGTADQHQFINFRLAFKPGVLQGRFQTVSCSAPTGAAVIWSNSSAAQFDHQVFRSVGIRRDIRQVDLGFHHGREFDLGFFGCFAQAL